MRCFPYVVALAGRHAGARLLMPLLVTVAVLALGGCASLPGTTAPMALPSVPATNSPTVTDAVALAVADVPVPTAASTPVSPLPTAAPDAYDVWSRMRRGFVLAPLEHRLVAAHKQRFESIDYFGKRAARIRQLLPVVVQAIEERKLPMELALVPLVESALNCNAKSAVAATGCWQFMHATAQDQRLMVSALVDQRRDLLKSTAAALDYLASLYEQTQDWHLAMAAYNWGIGRVLKLRASALAQGHGTDFASLAERMPQETRNYVPQIEALKRIIAQADADDLPEVPDQPLVQTVRLPKDLDVALAAHWAGLSVTNLMQLNHAVHPPLILAAATPELLLPAEAAERFEAAAQAHRGPWSSWAVVRTQGSARLTQLASRYGTTVQHLREANGGAPGLKPAAGSVLLVPSHGVAPAKADASLVATAQRQWVPEVVRITMKPRPKETLAQLAKRLQLPLRSLTRWNPELVSTKPLKKGSQVVLMVAPEQVEQWRNAPAKSGAKGKSKRGSQQRKRWSQFGVRVGEGVPS